jgi:hypothetical protein
MAGDDSGGQDAQRHSDDGNEDAHSDDPAEGETRTGRAG